MEIALDLPVFFYDSPMHVHRMMRSLSDADPAKLLIVQAEPKGVSFTPSPPDPAPNIRAGLSL